MSDDDFAATTCTHVRESFTFFLYFTVILLLFKSTGPASTYSCTINYCRQTVTSSKFTIVGVRSLNPTQKITYLYTYFIGSSPQGFSESMFHYKI